MRHTARSDSRGWPMDGAIIVSPDAAASPRANDAPGARLQHPDLRETGTRHAPRACRPLHRGPGDLGVRGHADHAVTPATRSTSSYRSPVCSTGPTRRCRRRRLVPARLDEVATELSALEVEDAVTIGDVVILLSEPRWCCASPTRSRTRSVKLGDDGGWCASSSTRSSPVSRTNADSSSSTTSTRTPTGSLESALQPRRARHRGSGRSQEGGGRPPPSEGVADLGAPLPRDIGCSPGYRGCRSPWSTTSSSGSAISRRSCGRRSTTSTTSRSGAGAGQGHQGGLSRLAESSILDRYS